MSLLVFQHHPKNRPAILGTILQSYGHRLRVVQPAEGEAMPPDLDDVDGVISLGGPMDVDQVDQHLWLDQEAAFLKMAHDAGVPIVGICLGAQLIAKGLGGEVAPMQEPEVGWHNVRLAFPGTIDPIYGGIAWDSMQFHSHGYEVTKLPPGGTPLSGSRMCRTQAFRVDLRTYGFQYHFEWSRSEIEAVARNGLIAKAGATEKVLQEADAHYDGYRRRAERLSHTIANLLFPLDKR